MSSPTPDENQQELIVKTMERAVAAESTLADSALVEAERTELLQVDYLDDEKHREARLRNDDFEQDMQCRREYADKIYKLIVFWLASVVGLLFTSGMSPGHSLSDAVLLMLIGSTTASVVGLLYIIVNYLFPKR